MTHARCDTPGKLRLFVRFGTDGQRWLDRLTKELVGYSLAESAWERRSDGTTRKLVRIHCAFVGAHMSAVLVTDLTGEGCDFARSHHTHCTRMTNRLWKRRRGTVWENDGLHAYEVVGWEGALRAIGMIAAWAAHENGTDDPYRSETFFGPRLWGKETPYTRPAVAVSDRTVLPIEATLVLSEPDVRPTKLSRAELVHEAEAAIDFEIARFYAQLAEPANPKRVRPFHKRRHRNGPIPEFSDDRRFIGPADLVAPVADEIDAWHRHYLRCRDEFPERQDVAFPAGTIRFRRLGAATDPCPPYRRASCPPRSRPLRDVPPRYGTGPP